MLALCLSIQHAQAANGTIRIPIETLSENSRVHPAPLDASLWLTSAEKSATSRMSVLIVPSPGQSRSEQEMLGRELSAEGFDTMAIDPRNKGLSQSTLVEDIQSGVIFLRSQPRTAGTRVIVIAIGKSANAAAVYASATPQMAAVLHSIVLLGPKAYNAVSAIHAIPVLMISSQHDKESTAAMAEAQRLCKTQCHSVSVEKNLVASNISLEIMNFLTSSRK